MKLSNVVMMMIECHKIPNMFYFYRFACYLEQFLLKGLNCILWIWQYIIRCTCFLVRWATEIFHISDNILMTTLKSWKTTLGSKICRIEENHFTLENLLSNRSLSWQHYWHLLISSPYDYINQYHSTISETHSRRKLH